MDRRFRGPTPEKSIKSSNIRIPEKELKKIIVKIKHNKPSTESQIDEIDHGLDRPEEIKIYRCQGSRPIFAREGIKVNHEDVGEKTVTSENSRRRHRTSSERDYSNNRENPRRSRDNSRRSRERYKDRSSSRDRDNLRRNRHSPNYSRASVDKASSSRRREYESHSRNRSRSRDSRRSRRSRSRSRSSRREFGRRRNSRSPEERHHRYDRQDYGHSDRRDRRHRRSRSPRFLRSPPRYDRHPTHVAPLDPAAIGAIPLIIPPELSFYGHEDALWFQAPIRGPGPVMLPRGFIPPRGMYRAPMYGMRPPIPPRLPPYLYQQRLPQYNQIRGSSNRPPRLP